MKFAEIIFTEDDIPYSPFFKDIYFSKDGGIKETEYVFIKGNNLEQRWKNHLQNDFTIVETGFGTGLNLLCTLSRWKQLTYNHKPKINYHSFEKYPLKKNDLIKILRLFEDQGLETKPLEACYDSILNNKKNIEIAPFFFLTVHLGDIVKQLPNVHFMADAWFLDGFTPSRNPLMWHEVIFSEMKNKTHRGGTCATYTSASQVRNQLKSAGFNIVKQKGFGKKREMIVGHIED